MEDAAYIRVNFYTSVKQHLKVGLRERQLALLPLPLKHIVNFSLKILLQNLIFFIMTFCDSEKR